MIYLKSTSCKRRMKQRQIEINGVDDLDDELTLILSYGTAEQLLIQINNELVNESILNPISTLNEYVIKQLTEKLAVAQEKLKVTERKLAAVENQVSHANETERDATDLYSSTSAEKEESVAKQQFNLAPNTRVLGFSIKTLGTVLTENKEAPFFTDVDITFKNSAGEVVTQQTRFMEVHHAEHVERCIQDGVPYNILVSMVNPSTTK